MKNQFTAHAKRLLCPAILLAGLVQTASADFAGWQHSGSLFILTTAEGANLPASCSEKDFPLLVRLRQDFFDFRQAKDDGADVRFSGSEGKPLAYEIELWDAQAGRASIWVRVPVIEGNARQELRMHWGKADAESESNGAAVFNDSNGYLGVWHLGDRVGDVVGNLESEDTGTTPMEGMIGRARHFPGGKGVFCGDAIQALPLGGNAHSTQAWFRTETTNGTVMGWGNEKAQGKVVMQYRSPPQVTMDCYFSNANVQAELPTPAPQWVHAVHTYEEGKARVYLNGIQAGEGNPRAAGLALERPARMWLGGWYHNYNFVGAIDEARLSRVARSADWVRLEYENQNPVQTLVGPLVQAGEDFSVSPARITMKEGAKVELTAVTGGAQRVSWSLLREGVESVIATNQFTLTFEAGRVRGDQSAKLRFQAVYADGVKTVEIPIVIQEEIPEPVFTLKAPARWNGRDRIEILAQIENLDALRVRGVNELEYQWSVSGLATIKEIAPGKLVLKRAQNSGTLTVNLALRNGGEPISASVELAVQEPERDQWINRVVDREEKPLDGQFYARDDKNEGTLHCNGTLAEKADAVFLRVYADEKVYANESRVPARDLSYAFAVKLKPGLIKYRVEFGSTTGKAEKILHLAEDLVCGDAYLIDGQSNALATDTGEESPRVTHEWVRSYARPRFIREGEAQNLWCKPVWKARPEDMAELGWWGMELAKQLVESQQVPVFMINAAVGGTRIDQHQRDDANPTDLGTIYGRMLWRVRAAKLTHGIRGILWHQGENDQGAAGPTGGYGWESYQHYFVEMSADWKEDFPNLQHYYLYQIWPNACSMGNGNGNMLREVQRTLPRLYAHMDVLSTLGIHPGGGCHYPLKGWGEFANLVQPLLERDFYGLKIEGSLTPPNLLQAYFTSETKSEIALEFDQPVIWFAELVSEFTLDGEKGVVEAGRVQGNVLTLKLKDASTAKSISYLDERSWSQDTLLFGKNGMAALTFCRVPIADILRKAQRP